VYWDRWRQPRERYERAAEYVVSAQIYHQLGDAKSEQAMREVIRQRFPDSAR